MVGRGRRRAGLAVASLLASLAGALAGCGGDPSSTVPVPVVAPGPDRSAGTTPATPATGPWTPVPPSSEPVRSSVPTPTTATTAAATSAPSTTAPTTAPATTTTTPAPTTTASTTTAAGAPPPASPPPVAPPAPPGPPDPAFGASSAAFDALAATNAAASMTIVRDGAIVVSRASGTTLGGAPATGDSPMVVASVSKVVVALAIARLAEAGRVDVGAPVPWAELGLAVDPGWGDVTVRELLDHTGGLRKERDAWFDEPGTCRDVAPGLLTTPPDGHRGRWYYSNGNYCLLGLLVEARSGLPLAEALEQLVLAPIGRDGFHLTTGGMAPGDVPYPLAPERLSRLGGAGTLLASTDDLALAFAGTTPADDAVLTPPGIFVDQYGRGHTGTVDGARSCLWRLDRAATVVSVTVAGDAVRSGGALCDLVVRAVAADLGDDLGPPVRLP